jgi:uncharacterized protein
LIQREADARSKEVSHSLQSNMLAYSSRWNPVIARMFGNSVGTSLDYPNLHRKLLGQGRKVTTKSGGGECGKRGRRGLKYR